MLESRIIMNKLIYVADDEQNIRELIKSFLEEEGFEVRLFENGDLLLKEFDKEQPDMVILDVMMPGTDGFSTCMTIRKKSDLPIILLTARDSDADYITGFTMGCDDYFTKPFSPIRLTMRVKAIFKRLSNTEGRIQESLELSCGDILIKTSEKAVYCKDTEVKLTNTEYALLSYMIENQEKAISREDMLSAVWGYDSEVETRVTDDIIRRLRKKLLNVESEVFIETIWGFGFKIGSRVKNG